MPKLPLVSLIIPVYNEERYLASCLSTLASQSYNPLEIIVVDDSSTDKSLEIAKHYPVKILRQSHLGPDAARNLGAKAAKGSILVFPDADMSFDPDYVKHIVQPIISHQAVGTFCIDEMVANPGNIWSCCWSINSGLPINRRIPEDYPPVCNVFRAIRKDVFVSAGGLDAQGNYNDDSTFSKKSGLWAIAAPKAICYHHNPETLAEVFFSTRWMGRSPLFPKTLKNFLRYSPLNSIRVAVKYIIFRHAPIAIIPFKIVYDLGILAGIFSSSKKAK